MQAITTYLCEVNLHASAAVAAGRRGTAPPEAQPGVYDSVGIAHLAAMEYAPSGRRHWARLLPRHQCQIGIRKTATVERLTIAVDGSATTRPDGAAMAGWGFVVALPNRMNSHGELRLDEY